MYDSSGLGSSSRRSSRSSSSSSVGCGCSPVIWLAGSILAGLLSFIKGSTLIWVVVHFCLSWVYVLYLCMGCSGGLPTEAIDRPASDFVAVLAAEEGTEEVEAKPEPEHAPEPEPELYKVVQ